FPPVAVDPDLRAVVLQHQRHAITPGQLHARIIVQTIALVEEPRPPPAQRPLGAAGGGGGWRGGPRRGGGPRGGGGGGGGGGGMAVSTVAMRSVVKKRDGPDAAARLFSTPAV